MFQFTYAVNELRRRLGRTILTALGLAAGVGLVIGIIGVSEGLDRAQADVLAPLNSVGTDILVTRVAGSTTPAEEGTPEQERGPRGGFFAEGPGMGPRGAIGLNDEDTDALLEENSNVVTDLSKLGEPGDQFTHDFFLSATLLSFPEEALGPIASIDGVAEVTGGLTQLAQHQTGTVPEIVSEIETGGERVTTTVRPDPLTPQERREVGECLERNGGGVQQAPQPGDGTEPRGAVALGGAFDRCMPERFREFQASVITPLQTIRQVVDPPSTDITNTSYTAAGIDPAKADVGLVTRAQLTEGAWLVPDEPNQVLVNVAYANTNDLEVGSAIPINGTDYTVAGLVNPTLTGSTADLYFPVATLQTLAGKEGRLTQVLVKASGAGSVDEIAAQIEQLLPGAEVVTTKSLADAVTGSLADARKLASSLGGALAVIVLVASFVIAMLLTLSSVAKRVREIGTLRAIGWSRGRVVRQVLGETGGIAMIGGLLGIALGFVVAAAVGIFAPELTATTSGIPGAAGSALSGLFGLEQQAAETSMISLTAPVTLATMLAGVGLALLGGLLAGSVGGWRAARLSPAEALRNVG